MPELEQKDYRDKTEAHMSVLAAEQLYGELRRSRSTIDRFTASWIILVTVAGLVLAALVWADVAPQTTVFPALLVMVGLSVAALTARAVALWRHAARAERTADMVQEMRHRLAENVMTRNPMDRARKESSKLLERADYDAFNLLEDARASAASLLDPVLPGASPAETEAEAVRSVAVREWETAARNLENAFDLAAQLLLRTRRDASDDLEDAEENAALILERAGSEYADDVARRSARLLERANAEAKYRVTDAQYRAEALLRRARADAAQQVGVTWPAATRHSRRWDA